MMTLNTITEVKAKNTFFFFFLGLSGDCLEIADSLTWLLLLC